MNKNEKENEILSCYDLEYVFGVSKSWSKWSFVCQLKVKINQQATTNDE